MNPTWTEQLPKDLRTDANMEIFNKYETIGDFAQKHLTVNAANASALVEKGTLEGKVQGLQEQMGKMFSIPGEDTDPDSKRKFLTALGVPENAEGYGVEGEAGKQFLELGFTKAQASAFTENMTKNQQAAEANRNSKIETAINEFNTQLGDKKDLTYKLAKDAIKHFYPEDKLEIVEKSILNNPEMIKVNAKIGELLQERPGMFVAPNNNAGTGTIYESMKDID